MLKAFQLLACTLFFSVGCLTALSRGQLEPWASNTDPTDVPKRYIQDVTNSPFTYTITMGGTMDGKMCSTLPGVWEPYEQTWESSRSLRLENVGVANVINPWLKLGPIDFFSQQTIADSVTAGLGTDRERALAIFYFYITHRYHKGNGDNGAQGDVSQAINVFGFNTCGNSTLCLADLLDKVGVRDCIFSHCPGHVVPQVFFDGRYNTLDGDMATLMLLRDNHTLANELDLVRDHDLIKRVHQYGIMSSMNPVRNNEDYAQYYTWEGETTQKLKGWNWWTMGMVLRPREAIEWRWGHETPVKYHGDMTGYPPISPDTIYNGLWEYAPDFHKDAPWRAGATVTNIANNNGVLTATAGCQGTIVWHMKVPYQFVGGTLTASGDGYAFEVGFLDPKDWRKTLYTPLKTLAEFDGNFKGRTADAREYWLRCTLTGNASLSAVKIRNDIQMAPLAMPSMTVGDNRFTYLEHTDDKTGANNARHLRLTHTWVERSQTRPAVAPESPVYPANVGESDGTDVVFQWSAATDPDGDAIADYHFQLSDRPDMRWPLSPNFDKYISRTPDKGKTCYTLPRPGLLTHGTTYYWHVKAKDSNGAWGPWSGTWSFTAQGPAYPLDVALKLNPDTGIGTLTWRANPVGRSPAKYRVYGSGEKGFTIHDAPYYVNLGDTKEFPNPFPANFVAEVAGTSLDVLGVGNVLPNANKAYYRVVAVDGKRKRSGDSDYVEAPRPFIYSTPVTSAPAGQPYRYEVKAIRSLGDLTRRDGAKPKPGTKFWKIEPLKFTLIQKPAWMSIDADAGLITGTSDGTGGTVIISVTLTKEHRLVHDKDAIVWGNEYEQSKTYETVGPVIQQFVVNGAKDARKSESGPIRKHPDNPHYFSYQGKPVVLITTDQHYGAVINLDFDYLPFLDRLHEYGMNLTRIYPGAYVEMKDQYAKGNPLGPAPNRYILPWKKSAVSGANPHLGVYKYDLDTWDEEYFKRLKDYVRQAALRDIIVEIAFFNGMYDDRWAAQPLYHANNVQGVGTCDFKQYTTLADKPLVEAQLKYVKKIAAELLEFDNIIYDISDEPEMQRQDSWAWNSAMLDALISVDHYKHLYGETAHSATPDFTKDPRISWLPTEYISPMEMTLDTNYIDAKPIIDVETAYYPSWYGHPVEETRAEGWYGMVGGLAGMIHLNAEFSTFNPSAKGTSTENQILPQKRVLMDFMRSLDFVKMTKFTGFRVTDPGALARGIAQSGKQYALYLFHGTRKWEKWPQGPTASRFNVDVGWFADTMSIELPRGAYSIKWINPATGAVIAAGRRQSTGGELVLDTPRYYTDIALKINLSP